MNILIDGVGVNSAQLTVKKSFGGFAIHTRDFPIGHYDSEPLAKKICELIRAQEQHDRARGLRNCDYELATIEKKARKLIKEAAEVGVSP